MNTDALVQVDPAGEKSPIWAAYSHESDQPTATASSRYQLVLQLLKGCTLGELNRLLLTDLRPIQMAAGGVAYTPKAYVPSNK